MSVCFFCNGSSFSWKEVLREVHWSLCADEKSCFLLLHVLSLSLTPPLKAHSCIVLQQEEERGVFSFLHIPLHHFLLYSRQISQLKSDMNLRTMASFHCTFLRSDESSWFLWYIFIWVAPIFVRSVSSLVIRVYISFLHTDSLYLLAVGFNLNIVNTFDYALNLKPLTSRCWWLYEQICFLWLHTLIFILFNLFI